MEESKPLPLSDAPVALMFPFPGASIFFLLSEITARVTTRARRVERRAVAGAAAA